MITQRNHYSDKPAENQEEIHFMSKALKIHRRVWGGDDARAAAQFLENLQQIQPALARSDEPGVRPAIPGVGPSPLSKEDNKIFEKYQASFDRICERLRLPGLRCATSKREDKVCMYVYIHVHVREFVHVCMCTCIAERESLRD